MTRLMNCPACKKEVSAIAGSCPHCGNPIKEKKASGYLTTLGAMFILIGFYWWPGFIIAVLIFIRAGVSMR